MAQLDLTQTWWRFHHGEGTLYPPSFLPAPGPNGPNTDVVLRFEATDPGIIQKQPPPPAGALMAVQGRWYRGYVARTEDAWDTDPNIGHFWAKIFPGTHQDRHGLLIIQENYALPATPDTNGQPQVRIFTGQYSVDQGFFAGYGADNWAWTPWGLFAFTLKPVPPPRV